MEDWRKLRQSIEYRNRIVALLAQDNLRLGYAAPHLGGAVVHLPELSKREGEGLRGLA